MDATVRPVATEHKKASSLSILWGFFPEFRERLTAMVRTPKSMVALWTRSTCALIGARERCYCYIWLCRNCVLTF